MRLLRRALDWMLAARRKVYLMRGCAFGLSLVVAGHFCSASHRTGAVLPLSPGDLARHPRQTVVNIQLLYEGTCRERSDDDARRRTGSGARGRPRLFAGNSWGLDPTSSSARYGGSSREIAAASRRDLPLCAWRSRTRRRGRALAGHAYGGVLVPVLREALSDASARRR